MEACRRSPAPCRQDRGDRAACGGKRARSRRTATLELRAARVSLAPNRATPRARSRSTCSPCPRPNPTRPPARTRSTGCCSAPRAAPTPRPPRPSSTWYERRWTIEEYFKVLKTGTRVEDRKLDHADDLRKCVAFDAITACHVFDLERIARDTPDIPANHIVSDDEIAILYIRLMAYGMVRARPPPDKAPGYPHLRHRRRKGSLASIHENTSLCREPNCSGKAMSTCDTPPSPTVP